MQEEKIFYTAKNDKVFKKILGDEDNKELLRKFLYRTLEIPIDNIEYLKNELLINYPKERRKTVDILVKSNNQYIHVELNNGHYDYLHMRNFCYIANLYSRKTREGKKYDLKEKFTQINFTYHNEIKSRKDKDKILKDNKILRIYNVMDKENIPFIDNLTILEYNMDKVMQIWYHKDNEYNKYKHLIMLDSNIEELEELSNGDELVEEFTNEIEELNGNETYASWLTPEEDEEMILNTEKYLSFQEGMEKKNREVALSFLNNGVDINIVSKSTGLSIEELNKMQNND